ncbi:MAG: cell surface protein SprA, partial [Calditrichota bacterium]
MVSFGRLGAEVGFRSEFPWERLLDPSRFQPRFGFASVVWDTLARDTTLADTSVVIPVDSLLAPPDTSAGLTPTPQPSTGASTSTSTGVSSSGTTPPDTSQKQIKPLTPPSPPKPSPQKESSADTLKPPPWRPTRVNFRETSVESEARLDTATGYIVLSPKLHGVPLPQGGAVSEEEYITRAETRANQEAWRESVLDKLPKSEKKTGTGINISIPVFTSKRAQQIFGGSNVGLTVTGDISITGSLRTEKRDELQRDNPNPTSYQFKIDQTQRFNIKGKVGEKVEVAIDQDSEKLFEFENSLRVTYTGNPDEIIQKIEAGNVNLSLPGAKLISSSTKHEGLFGLKTESRIGALKLTAIASLDKSEQQIKTVKGGAETGRPILINPQDFISNTYFFLDDDYREHYRHRKADDLSFTAMPTERQIIDIVVYKSVELNNQNLNAVPGWALFNPFEDLDTTQAVDRERQRAAFLPLELGADYSVDRELGYIKLTQRIDENAILAAAYITPVDTVGDIVRPEQPPFILKLIKPTNPQPSDSTWKLMWRHVYNLGATGIDPTGFEGKITERSTGSDSEPNRVPPRTFIQAFGLDFFGPIGELTSDGQIDKIFLRYGEGELHFPDLQPFEPEGWYRGDEFIKTDLADSTYFNPIIYTGTRYEMNNITAKLRIEAQYKNISATYNLDFNVLEGSEEVYLNGQRLARDQDYSIDYVSGTLTILRKDALAADADLEIKYQKGQLFQLDTQTMLGIRAEYDLGNDSYIGATVLHRSESGMDQRVRLGADPPMRNSIWGLNTSLTFKPQFMTRAVDWLPLIETNKESEITFEGEVAQVFPNPNILNSASTGDNEGVAYIDDFESIKRTMSLGINRRQWTPAGFPAYDNRGEGLWRRKRGRLLWFNPWDQVKITEIWPERQVQAQDNTTPVLNIEVQPWWTQWGASAPPGADPEKYWVGIMRYLGAGFADQTQTKYLEIWLNRGSATSGEMYIDLGMISEDVIPNGKLDTEDRPMAGFPFGNTILDGDEDTGMDGAGGRDPADTTDINGDRIFLPSYDDYTYSIGNRDDYTGINGTEGNRSDESGRHPDSEDLDGDTYLDQVNNFYRYRLDLSQGDANRYIAGGLGNARGWRLYRIPLSDSLTVGKPSLNQIEYARIWFTGFPSRRTLQIAQMELVGNEWQEQKVPVGVKPPVKVTVINTNDNPDYKTPPGVSGELDPVTNLRAQEQSLALKIERL